MGGLFHPGRSTRTKHLWSNECLYAVVFPLELNSEDMAAKLFVNYV